MLKKRKCQQCKKIFEVNLPPSREKSGRGKFCSTNCKKSWSIGKHFSPKSEFKQGRKMIFTKQHRENLSKAMWGKCGMVGADNPKWKGDMVGYHALHSWVKRQLGKPSECAHCGGKHKLQWANKSREYKRDTEDWTPLCYWCHRKYDMGNWGIASNKFPEICKKQ